MEGYSSNDFFNGIKFYYNDNTHHSLHYNELNNTKIEAIIEKGEHLVGVTVDLRKLDNMVHNVSVIGKLSLKIAKLSN